MCLRRCDYVRLYLDTNIILDWFRNVMVNVKKPEKFKVPRKLEFLSSQELELIVSTITKIEVFRYLKSDWNANREQIEEIWKRFIESFKIKYLIIEKMDFEELSSICLLIPTRKKTLVNLMHLQISKKEDLWFLTGEKRLLDKYKTYYNKSLSYIELRKRLSSP